MRILRLFQRVGFVGWLLSALLLLPHSALGSRPTRERLRRAEQAHERQRRERSAAAIQPQVDAARRAVAAAKVELADSERNFQAADNSTRDLLGQLKNLKDSVRPAERELAAEVEKIEASQPADSAFLQARSRFRAAEAALREARQRVSRSQEYRAKYRAAADSPEQSKHIDQVQKRLLEGDADYAQARSELSAARPEYESRRATLLEGNGRWVQLSQALRELRGSRARLENQLSGRLLTKNAAEKKYLAAKAARDRAESVVAEGEQAIAKLRGPQNSGKKPSGKKR